MKLQRHIILVSLVALLSSNHILFADHQVYLGDVQGIMIDLKSDERSGTCDLRSPGGRAWGY